MESSHLDKLDSYLVNEVLCFLDGKSLLRVEAVSRMFSGLAKNNMHWEQLLRSDWHVQSQPLIGATLSGISEVAKSGNILSKVFGFQTVERLLRLSITKSLESFASANDAKAESVTVAKDRYKSLHNKRMQRLIAHRQQSVIFSKQQKRSREHFHLRPYVIALTSCIGTCGPVLLTLLFFLLLTVKLTSPRLLDTSYSSLFTPIWMLIFVVVIVFSVTCYASRHENTPAEKSAWRDVWLYVRSTPSGGMVDRVFHRNGQAYLHCAVFCFLCGLIPVLLCAKLESFVDEIGNTSSQNTSTQNTSIQNTSILNETSSSMNRQNASLDGDAAPNASLSWAVTLAPAFAAMIWWLLAPLFQWKLTRSEYLFLNVVAWLPATTTLALLAAKLEGADISMALVFLPLWIIGGVVCCIGTIITAAAGIEEHRKRDDQDSCTKTCLPFLAAFTVALCFVAPLVIFFILMAVHEDYPDRVAMGQLFTPLLVWLSLLLAFTLCLARGLCKRNLRVIRRSETRSVMPGLICSV